MFKDYYGEETDEEQEEQKIKASWQIQSDEVRVPFQWVPPTENAPRGFDIYLRL